MLRILLVEDSKDDADLLRFELEDAGIRYELRQVWSRTMLLEALKDFDPTIAISDMHLPGYSGLEALRLVHDALPHLPLLLFSGDPNSSCEELPALLLDKSQLARLPEVIRLALQGR